MIFIFWKLEALQNRKAWPQFQQRYFRLRLTKTIKRSSRVALLTTKLSPPHFEHFRETAISFHPDAP
jgi:hypothetical protein